MNSLNSLVQQIHVLRAELSDPALSDPVHLVARPTLGGSVIWEVEACGTFGSGRSAEAALLNILEALNVMFDRHVADLEVDLHARRERAARLRKQHAELADGEDVPPGVTPIRRKPRPGGRS